MLLEDIKDILDDQEFEFFISLAEGYKKNFINHVTSAKTEKTKLKRIEEFKSAMNLECRTIFDYKKKINPPKIKKEELTDEENIKLFFAKITNEDDRNKSLAVYNYILEKFPELHAKYAWNQPMIYYNKTFITCISPATKHYSIALEKTPLLMFSDAIKDEGYELLKKGFKVSYTQEINLELIDQIITFSIDFKKDYQTVFEK